MRPQKLLVIVASVCLMAFFNVLSLAQEDGDDQAPQTLEQCLEAATLIYEAQLEGCNLNPICTADASLDFSSNMLRCWEFFL